MAESDMELGETTPTKQMTILVPETPSPVFSKLVHKNDSITSPSKRKYWFEDVRGKVGAETKKNGHIKVAEYDHKKTAFERLKKMREKKSMKKESFNGARSQRMWPSDSDSDNQSDSNSSETLSSLLNREGKVKQKSPYNSPAKPVFDLLTSAAGSSPDSPSLNLPLRKRIKLGMSQKFLGSCGLNTPAEKKSTSSDPCSSSSHSNKHHKSKSKHCKTSSSDFVSAKDVLNCVSQPRSETAPRDSSSVFNNHSLDTQLNCDNLHSKRVKKQSRKDNGPKSVLDRLKSMNKGSNVDTVDMELTPTFSEEMVQPYFRSSVKPPTLPPQNFYNKRPPINPRNRESTTSSSESERQSRRDPKRRSKRPAPIQYIDEPEVVDIESEEDAVVVVNQMESDASMARRLQEEMDREFALAIAESHEPSHSEAGVGASHHRGSRSRAPVSSGLGMSVFHDMIPEEGNHIPDFPFMAMGGWGQSPLALLTSHVALLGSSGSWTSPVRNRRSARGGGRGSRGRTGRRNAVFEANSPGMNGEDYEALLDLAESIGDARPKGLTKNQINCLPVKKYVPSSGESSQNTECLVCMCDFEKNENIRILTCFHDFHSKCIDKWLKGNNTCPICRVEVKLT